MLNNLLEDTKFIALNTLYPFSEDFEGKELPNKYYNWQIRACVELHKWQENSGIKSYSENGLSWSRDTDGVLPETLLDELMPHVGVPSGEDD